MKKFFDKSNNIHKIDIDGEIVPSIQIMFILLHIVHHVGTILKNLAVLDQPRLRAA